MIVTAITEYINIAGPLFLVLLIFFSYLKRDRGRFSVSSLNQFLLNVPMYAPFTFTLERYFIPGSQSKEIISPE